MFSIEKQTLKKPRAPPGKALNKMTKSGLNFEFLPTKSPEMGLIDQILKRS